MIQATDLKNGTTFLMDGKPYKVIKYSHQKIGRGGATVKVNLRNLATGEAENKTFNSSAKFDDISTIKKPLQYLYKSNKSAVFMDIRTYNQLEIPLSLIETELRFIKEGESVNVLLHEDRPLSIDIPPKVKLQVRQTPPGVKGNSATNIYKTATLENDLQVKVPLFVNSGNEIIVDTRTGEYVERAK